MSAYPLQALLGLRERAKAEAERALAEATHALAAAEALHAELTGALERARAERARQVQGHLDRVLAQGADAGALTRMDLHVKRLEDAEAAHAQALSRQARAVAEAAREREAHRLALAEAARELQALQEHHARWAAERRRAREAREEQAQEEVGSALHLLRQRK